MPSSTSYLVVALVAAMVLFLGLWWMLVNGGDEAPWLPAGLAASVVLLVTMSAREVVMRRAWTRYLLENGIQQNHSAKTAGDRHRRSFSASLHSAALRQIQKRSAAAEMPGAPPEAHLDVAQLCHDFLTSTDEALRSGRLGSEKGIVFKAGKERVKVLHRHHTLTWAREQALVLAREAQQRARMSDKIETANRALDCIDSALRLYPDEAKLNESKVAIREFMASVKVGHWVELAERAAFKGQHRRAIERYQDALFYLEDESVKADVRRAGIEKIEQEISRLRARISPNSEEGGDGQG